MRLNANDYDAKEILKIIRENTGLKQKSFGETINKSERTIQNYEGGQAKYTMDVFLNIIKTHGFEVIITKKDRRG